MIKNYELLDEDYNGNQLIKLTCNPYSGIIYTYGKVSLKEDTEKGMLNIAFEYDILDYNDKTLTNKEPFETYIGRILEELLHQGVAENSITYTGGVDENRTKDSDESDL